MTPLHVRVAERALNVCSQDATQLCGITSCCGSSWQEYSKMANFDSQDLQKCLTDFDKT